MQRLNWIVGGLGAVAGLALAAGLLWVLQGQRELPSVSAGIPAESELIDLTDRDLIERVLPGDSAIFYQYVDDHGDVQFVPTLHEVPEAWRARAGRVEMAAAPPQSPAASRMLRKLGGDRLTPDEDR